MTNLKITNYTVDDPLYKQACVLREQVLRTPLGLVLRDQDVAQDANEQMRHFAALDDGVCVATVSLLVSGQQAELRQMCVDSDYRGRQVGERLVKAAEYAMAELYVKQIAMHARVAAQRFYEGLGYAVSSEPHSHLGIEHIWMSRFISM